MYTPNSALCYVKIITVYYMKRLIKSVENPCTLLLDYDLI